MGEFFRKTFRSVKWRKKHEKNQLIQKKVGAFLLAFMLVLSSTGVVSAATQYKWGFRNEGTGKGTISCDGVEYSGDEFLDEGMHKFEILAEEGSELTKLVYFFVESDTDEVTYKDITEEVTKDGKLDWGVFYEGGLIATFDEIKEETPVEPTKEISKWSLRTEGEGTIYCEKLAFDGGDQDVAWGEYTFEITAKEGYKFDKLYLLNKDGNVADDVTEYVKDGKVQWTINYEGGLKAVFVKDEPAEETPVAPTEEVSRWSLRTEGEGKIYCKELGFDGGDQDVAWGEYTFKITAEEGYKFDKLYLLDKDGNVAEDVTKYVKDGEVQWTINYEGGLKAVFVKEDTPVETPEESDAYRWSLTSDGHGYIKCYDGDLGDHIFAKGEEVEFEIVANDGYEFDKLYSIDENGGLHEETEYVNDNKVTWTIAYNGGLLVTFKEIRHHEGWRWGLLNDGNGTIGCTELGYDGGEEFVQEGTYTFEIKANEGYKFDKLYLVVNDNETDVTEYVVDGTSVEWTVAYDGALKATFVKVEEETPVEPEEPAPFYGWRWGLLNDGNGTIGCTELGYDGGEEFVQEGTYTFEIEANEGYKFDKLYLVVDDNETDVTEYVVDGASVEWRVAYDGALKATFVKVEEETPVVPEEPENPATPVDPVDPVDPEEPATPVEPEEPATPVDPEDKTEEPATPADPEDKTETPADKTEAPAETTETAEATKTGDATAFLPFVAVMMVSAAGAAIVLKKRYHA